MAEIGCSHKTSPPQFVVLFCPQLEEKERVKFELSLLRPFFYDDTHLAIFSLIKFHAN